MLPLYMNTTNENKNKLHKVIMRGARTAIGNYCCKSSTNQILAKCKWLNVKSMITHSAITSIHSYIMNNTPKSILNLINIRNNRTHKDLTLKYIPRTSKFKNFYMANGLKIYNQIPTSLKLKPPHIFKKLTKNWLTTNIGVNDTCD